MSFLGIGSKIYDEFTKEAGALDFPGLVMSKLNRPMARLAGQPLPTAIAELPFPKSKPTFNALLAGPELQSPIASRRFQTSAGRVRVSDEIRDQFLTPAHIEARDSLRRLVAMRKGSI